ncbi:glycosyltransferase family 2 protein [Jannaschia sp. R86511]|uniref:glycosyltransferase family 2 protein n=1 Tax=Jannaschia sp. R86511 TaxID=3093853 RepID=UPI0036D3EC7D
MTTTPLVTVGLPVYNGARFLRAAIDSLLAQDLTDFELLIADNGSTDDSVEIARAAAERDQRVVVHRSEQNRGAAWNYNRLVDLARGTYFKWAAHDDLVEPTFLSRCVEVLQERPEVVLAYTRAVDVDEQDDVVREYELLPYAADGTPTQRARTVVLNPSPCFESFGVMRTEQLRRTRRIGAYTSSDRTLFLELALMGRFVEVPEVLFRHRQHPERSVTRYRDDRARNVWFDPSWEGRASAPRWRLLREYGVSIVRSPIPRTHRLRAGTLLPRWALANRRALVREAASMVLGRATTVTGHHEPRAVNR